MNEYFLSVEDEDVKGHCHICGVLLSAIELSDTPVSKVCCSKHIEAFTENFEEIEKEGFIF